MGRKRRGPRRQFTAEFKAEAVQLVNQGDRTLKEVARELGIGGTTLWKWCVEAEGGDTGRGQAEADATQETPEQELQRLRKENRELRMEKEILKKAAAFFARENS